LYGFASGDPVNFTDPIGLAKCPPDCFPLLGFDQMSMFMTVAAMAGAYKQPIQQFNQAVSDVHSLTAVSLGLQGLLETTVTGAAAAAKAGRAVDASEVEGRTVFRDFGGTSGQYGPSWTMVPPGSVSNFRAAAGLPSGNTMQYEVSGVVADVTGIRIRPSSPGAGGAGGLQELLIPNAKAQVAETVVRKAQ